METTLKQMGPLKSPGHDSYGACFYQSYWSIVSDNVFEAVLSYLNGGSLEKSINFTYVALIPKVSKPKNVGEYIPISLCNVLYKLIAKTIANRLMVVLNDTIAKN